MIVFRVSWISVGSAGRWRRKLFLVLGESLEEVESWLGGF